MTPVLGRNASQKVYGTTICHILHCFETASTSQWLHVCCFSASSRTSRRRFSFGSEQLLSQRPAVNGSDEFVVFVVMKREDADDVDARF
jgi:hypothetical protein